MDDDYRDDDYQDDDYQDDDYIRTPAPVGGGSSGRFNDDDDDRGSGGDDDYDDDYVGGPAARGLVDDDYARKLFRDDDYITGRRLRRRDFSDDDYSSLPSSADRLFNGTRRSDNLIGKGRGVEVLVGRRGDDNFLLGNRKDDFYDDDKRRGGRSSYAVIKDFSFRQDDTIFLHGRRGDYDLSMVKVDGIRGVGVFLEGGKRDTLIGVIQGQRPGAFDLTDSSTFQFFGG